MKKDIDVLTHHIEKKNVFTSSLFDYVYPFPTENVSGVLDSYDFNNKSCLSVLGSSAQVLYMYLKGARNVTAFDINPFTIYYFYFVKAFIESKLNVSDFVYLMTGSMNAGKKEIYDEISKHLKGKYKTFWDYTVEKYGVGIFSGRTKIKYNSLFQYYDGDDVSDILKYSGYLNNDYIRQLREKSLILNPTFYNINIKDIMEIPGTFDFIYLSNIIAYADKAYKSKYGNDLYKQMLYNLKSKLLNNGVIYAGYVYGNDTELVKKIFPEEDFMVNKFPGYRNDNKDTEDGCLVIKK